MTREEAEEYAKEMSFRDAVCNALQGKCISYRKATIIKLFDLLNMIEQQEGSENEEKEPCAVLDKVRAEIDAARFIDKDTKLCKNANASGLEVAMDIIDKYIEEGKE